MTTSTATAQTRIAEIDAILVGPKTQAIGDRSISYDFEELRKERARLMRIVASSTTSSFRRVVFKSG